MNAAADVHVMHADAAMMTGVGNCAGDEEGCSDGGETCHAIAKPQAGFGTHSYHYAHPVPDARRPHPGPPLFAPAEDQGLPATGPIVTQTTRSSTLGERCF